MTLRLTPRAILAILLCLVASLARAQWSDDPAVNLAIADRSASQVLPKIAIAPDGHTWVSWFDQASGNYDVYLQRLDGTGHETFAHNGLLVSSHMSNTSLVDWDLLADSDNGAVLVFSDARAGSDLDVYAYRIAPDGTFLWGPDGVTLSVNSDFEPAPRVAETSDGHFVFVWPRLPSTGAGALTLQKLAPDGVRQFGPTGLSVPGSGSEKPAFSDVVGSDGGSFIVSWVRDITTFSSPRHVRAQKFSSAGAALWGASHVAVYDALAVPIAYTPELISDGAGGAVLGWYRSDLSNQLSAFVQHVDAAGHEVFPHNGVELATTAGMHKIAPTILYRPSGDILAVFTVRNSNQSQAGIRGQRITAAGARAWTADGAFLLPLSASEKASPRSVPLDDGAAVFWMDAPAGLTIDARVLGLRVDLGGNLVWLPSPITVGATPSGKDDLVVDVYQGEARMAWQDQRTDNGDILVQNVHLDAQLGIIAPREVSPPGSSQPLVFSSAIDLVWEPGSASRSDEFDLYRADLSGLSTPDYGTCHESPIPTNTTSDTDLPVSGAGFGYLVGGANAAGKGPLGTDSSGNPRTPSVACP